MSTQTDPPVDGTQTPDLTDDRRGSPKREGNQRPWLVPVLAIVGLLAFVACIALLMQASTGSEAVTVAPAPSPAPSVTADDYLAVACRGPKEHMPGDHSGQDVLYLYDYPVQVDGDTSESTYNWRLHGVQCDEDGFAEYARGPNKGKDIRLTALTEALQDGKPVSKVNGISIECLHDVATGAECEPLEDVDGESSEPSAPSASPGATVSSTPASPSSGSGSNAGVMAALSDLSETVRSGFGQLNTRMGALEDRVEALEGPEATDTAATEPAGPES